MVHFSGYAGEQFSICLCLQKHVHCEAMQQIAAQDCKRLPIGFRVTFCQAKFGLTKF